MIFRELLVDTHAFTNPLPPGAETHTISVGSTQRGRIHSVKFVMGDLAVNSAAILSVLLGSTTHHAAVVHLNGTVPEQPHVYDFKMPAGTILRGEPGEDIGISVNPVTANFSDVTAHTVYEIEEETKGN